MVFKKGDGIGPKNTIEDVWKRIFIKPNPVIWFLWNDDCWEWMKGKNKDEYGRTMINHKNYGVHHFVYEQIFGPIPNGMFVLHHCDNPPCCNPLHLFLGTQKDNMKDMVLKGRGRSETWGKNIRNIKKSQVT